METATIETPVGHLEVSTERGKLKRIQMSEAPSSHSSTAPEIKHVESALQRFFTGDYEALDALEVNPDGTEFQHAVWNFVRSIPAGQTLSYGEVAGAIGKPNSARAVGGALNKNPILLAIPCHRVVGSSGELTGFACGIDKKQILLELEAHNA